jgi:hypothetical protein
MEIGATVISVIIMAGFITMLGIVVTRPFPQGSDGIAHEMLGALATMSTVVVNYWLVRDSAARKDAMLADAQAALAISSPPPTGGPQ